MYPFRYRCHGLAVASQVRFPELISRSSDREEADVFFRRLPARDRFREGRVRGVLEAQRDRAVLRWPEVGRYRVRDGRYVSLRPVPDAEAALVRLSFLGPVTGVLQQQRGRLVLHGSGVRVNGRALCFLGGKGAGKSTVAAALYTQGYGLVADDLIVLEGTDVWPGFPRLKLDGSASSAVGAGGDGALDHFHPRIAKRGWTLSSDRFGIDRIPVDAFVQLEWGDEFAITRRRGPRSVDALLRNVYWPDGKTSYPCLEDHFDDLVELAGRVPVYRIRRPRCADRIVADSERIVRELGSTIDEEGERADSGGKTASGRGQS